MPTLLLNDMIGKETFALGQVEKLVSAESHFPSLHLPDSCLQLQEDFAEPLRQRPIPPEKKRPTSARTDTPEQKKEEVEEKRRSK